MPNSNYMLVDFRHGWTLSLPVVEFGVLHKVLSRCDRIDRLCR